MRAIQKKTFVILKLQVSFIVLRDNASNSIKVIGAMSRCNKIYPYSYEQSIYTKCVSEILEHRLTIKKEYLVDTWKWIYNCKKLGQV